MSFSLFLAFLLWFHSLAYGSVNVSIGVFFFLMIRRPPRSTLDRSSAASDVYKRQLEGNTVEDGDQGYLGEGYVNLPISDNAAIRLVGWAKHDAGYIDNVGGRRGYRALGVVSENSKYADNDYNDVCLLYTSDAADERSSVELGGRRIIKKKKQDEIN